MEKDNFFEYEKLFNDESTYNDDYSIEELINSLTGTSEDDHSSRKSEDDHPSRKSRDDHSTEKSIIFAAGVAIVATIMAAIGIIFIFKNWLTVFLTIIVSTVLCTFIIGLCIHLLNEEFNIIKWKRGLKVLFVLGVFCSIIVLTMFIVYIWPYIFPVSNKDIDPAIDMEQSRISDTLIIADMSSHNMHEKNKDADSNEPESRPVIQVSRSSFMQCLQAASQGEIRGVRYQKYKRGEEQQMFAIVEEATGYEKTDEENLYGTIWYVDKYGAKEMDSEAKEYKWPYLFFIDDSNENVYLAYKKYQTDDTIIYVLGVNETGPYHPAISGQGSDLCINEYDEIEITENGVYYFCLEGSFKEYGGIEINLAELLRIQDAKIRNTVSSLLEEECQINTIYYRENGIININFSKEYETGEIRYFNITFRYDGEKAKIVPAETGEEYGEGIYLDALIPSIASYPSEFPY